MLTDLINDYKNIYSRNNNVCFWGEGGLHDGFYEN